MTKLKFEKYCSLIGGISFSIAFLIHLSEGKKSSILYILLTIAIIFSFFNVYNTNKKIIENKKHI